MLKRDPVRDYAALPGTMVEELRSTYCASALYTVRSCSSPSVDGRYLVRDDDLRPVCVVGQRNEYAYVFPLTDLLANVDVLDELRHLIGCGVQGVIYKRIPVSMRWSAFRQAAERNLAPVDSELLEDERTDDQYLQLSKEYAAVARENSKSLRRRYQQFKNSRPNLTWRYDEQAIEALDQDMIWTLCQGNSKKHLVYESMVSYLRDSFDRDRHLVWLIALQDNKPLGLYIADRIDADGKEAGLYCAISSTREGGATEWMDLEVLRRMHTDHQVGVVHLGGSETRGVKTYVDKLRPLAATGMTSTYVTDVVASPIPLARDGKNYRQGNTEQGEYCRNDSDLVAGQSESVTVHL